VLLISFYVNFTDQRKETKTKMENFAELQRQARAFLAQNPDFLPLPYVEDIIFHGGVDRYVVAGGVDINTPEGSHILNK
jgi:hypothetical protein